MLINFDGEWENGQVQLIEEKLEITSSVQPPMRFFFIDFQRTQTWLNIADFSIEDKGYRDLSIFAQDFSFQCSIYFPKG